MTDVRLEVLAPHLELGGVQPTGLEVNKEGKKVYDEDEGNGGWIQLPMDNFNMTDVVPRCSTTIALYESVLRHNCWGAYDNGTQTINDSR